MFIDCLQVLCSGMLVGEISEVSIEERVFHFFENGKRRCKRISMFSRISENLLYFSCPYIVDCNTVKSPLES